MKWHFANTSLKRAVGAAGQSCDFDIQCRNAASTGKSVMGALCLVLFRPGESSPETRAR